MTLHTWSQPAFATIAQLIAARIGLAYSASTQETIERAARRAMAKLAIGEADEFARQLASGEPCWQSLIDEITVGETYFLRNPEHFEAVRNTVLPALCQLRGDAHTLRVWSAGCASGEEAYSLAIVLDQAGLGKRARVLGSDISQRALSAARAGRYRDWSFRGFDPMLIAGYFERIGSEHLICERIRKSVSFHHFNLTDDTLRLPAPHADGVDLIFCRNVFIYLDPGAIARVERRLFAALAPGGWLITGPSDPVLGTHAPFEVSVTPSGLRYQRPLRAFVGTAETRSYKDSDAPIGETQPGFDRSDRWTPPAPAEPATHGVPDLSVQSALADNAHSDGAAAESRSVDRSAIHAEARAALARAEHARVIELARALPDDAVLAELHVRAVWNRHGALEAERVCAELAARHPLSTHLHYLHAVVLLHLARHAEALSAVRRTLYLDRTCLIAHFTLGSILEAMRNFTGAQRAYRNAYEGCASCAPEHAVALGDGISAGGLASAAALALAALAGRAQ